MSIFIFVSTFAQDSSSVKEYTLAEKVGLYSMTGIIVPLAIAGVVVSIVPPSGGIVIKNGTTYGVLNLETGVGRGQFRETGIFTDYRVTINYSHIYHSRIRDVVRLEFKKDFHFDFVDRRKIFLSGFHISGGIITDFPNKGYTAGAGLWLQSPMLPFLGFFPSHTFGVTYRYNSYFSGRSFQEVTLGVSSAVTF